MAREVVALVDATVSAAVASTASGSDWCLTDDSLINSGETSQKSVASRSNQATGLQRLQQFTSVSAVPKSTSGLDLIDASKSDLESEDGPLINFNPIDVTVM